MKGNYLTVPIGMIVLQLIKMPVSLTFDINLFLPDNITGSQVTETVHNTLYLHT
jgi:hypothetical protein